MYKYKLKNVDCAVCASKVEDALRSLDEVKNVSVDPVNSIINIDYGNLQKIQETVKKVEKAAEVEEYSADKKKISHFPKFFEVRNEIIKIFLTVALLLAGVIFIDALRNTPFSIGEYAVFIAAYLISGWRVLSKALRNMIHGRIMDENFLMMIATLGAIAIRELPEAVAVMLFYEVGEFIQNLAVNKSRRSIKSLLEIRPDYANLRTKEGLEKISPDKVAVGETVIVKAGEKIPLDGKVIEGSSFVDTFALTGEPVPKSIKTGENVLAGMINKTGLLAVKTTKLFEDSSISKIMELVENAGRRKARTERFITTFARYYTPVVVVIAILIASIPPIFFGELFSEWLYRALVILVISCPCALVISIPLSYFGGIGGASKKGILVKGTNFLDALLNVKTIVFDKTGTLTHGVFKVTDIVTKNNFSREEILKYAAQAESQSNHPIAKSIIEAYGKEVNLSLVNEYNEITGRGIKAKVENRNIIIGNDKFLHEENIYHEECFDEGTVIHLAIDNKYAGYIIISDIIKEDSIEAVAQLKKMGIEDIIMFTGDNSNSAKLFADKLNINKFFAGMLPQDKVAQLENIISEKEGKSKVAFVGDGINDAPVIARADVGFAMGGLGSDAAVESADIVLMEDLPSKIPASISVAKKTRNIVWQNIAFAMGIKAFFIVMGGLGLASMWEAVFADMGVAIIAILNAARMLR
jgi:Zn2+/Cd2+-exporting ATPase